MNWLAHLLLSEQTPECWMGSLLPDFLRDPELQMLPLEFRRGIRLHRAIDSFTDSHPVVLQSRRRVPPPFRRYAGIVIDMFYDHLLATQWERYSEVDFEEFTSAIYAGLQRQCANIPDHARERMEWMIREDLLGSYRKREGIRWALERIGCRLKRPVDLGGATALLEEANAEFLRDFDLFFPQLHAHVRLL
ncbi:MAG: DUF479 domain-containing protein [Verrucomicrobiaceae bacterium]|nr:MAG: DUF479 domain-containing protein [Verrucomicrobiaceae bacterium]